MNIKYGNLLGILTIAYCSNAYSASNDVGSGSVTLYGVVDASIAYIDNGTAGHSFNQVSGDAYGSRWGLRGTEDLGGGLRANFWLESGFLINTGTATTTGGFSRKSLVGLSSDSWGRIDLGRDYNPLFSSVIRIDPFDGGTTAAAVGMQGTAGAQANNAIFYTTPTIKGFTFKLMYALGESATVPYSNGNRWGANAFYVNGPLMATVAGAFIKSAPAGQTGTRNDYSVLVGGTYDLGFVKLAGDYEFGHNFSRSTAYYSSNSPPVTGGQAVPYASSFATWLVGATVPVGVHKIVASIQGYNDKTAADQDAYLFGLGGYYYLSKTTFFYGSVSKLINTNHQRFALSDAGRNSFSYAYDASTPNINPQSVAIGIVHLF